MFKSIKSEEILTCLILIVIGYFIAKIFSKNSCDSFRISTQSGKDKECPEGTYCLSYDDIESIFNAIDNSKNIKTKKSKDNLKFKLKEFWQTTKECPSHNKVYCTSLK